MRTSILKTDLPVVDATARVGVQAPHRSPPGPLPQPVPKRLATSARTARQPHTSAVWGLLGLHFARPIAITSQNRVKPVFIMTLGLAGTRPSPFRLPALSSLPWRGLVLHNGTSALGETGVSI